MKHLLSVKPIEFNLRVLEDKISNVKTYFSQFRWVLPFNIGCLRLNHSDFMQINWFWPNFSISRILTHLYWSLLKKRKTAGLQTNKQYFPSFSFPKVSYHYGCLWMAIWQKITFSNIAKIQFLVFPLNLAILGM